MAFGYFSEPSVKLMGTQHFCKKVDTKTALCDLSKEA